MSRYRGVKGWDEHVAIREAIAAAEQDLGEEGRVLVRASGTEPKIRVMVKPRARNWSSAGPLTWQASLPSS